MLTVTLLAIVAIAAANLHFQSQNFIKRSRLEIEALALAQEKIEEMKAISHKELFKLGNINAQESVFFKGICFVRTTLMEWENENLVKITVKLSWEGREIALVTYRGRY